MPSFENSREPSTEIQIWDCDPLLVAHVEDGVVYAARTDVEFEPDGQLYGKAKALVPSPDGWNPSLVITDWHDLPNLPWPYNLLRPGRILFGHDEEGNSFSWHIGRAADIYLTEEQPVPRPAEEPPLEN